ncbi:MAG: PAS domain-containing protein [Oscillospiraceae bacterium]
MQQFSEINADLTKLSLPIGILLVTAYPEYNILFANAKFCQMLGFSATDIPLQDTRKSAWNCIYAGDVERLQAEAAQRNGNPEPFEVAYRMVKKDGSILWVNQCSQHMLDASGNELVYAYYTDITAQKQLEETIRAEAGKYETLVNSVPGGVGMYQMDEKFTPLFISDGVYALCNMTREEYEQATPNSTLDIFHPDDRQGLLDTVAAARAENRKFEYAHRVLQKDGSYRWMRVSGKVMDGQDGRPVLYTVFTDMQEQVQAERALRESESRYAAAVRAANINIWEYDYDTDIMHIFSTSPRANPEGGVILNYLQTVVSEGHIREDCAPLLFDMIERLKGGAKEVTADLWIRQNPTDDFWCEQVIYTNEFDERGRPAHAYCVGRDITREKEAEKRYRDELSYREAMQKATMASINVNLTQDIILDYKSVFPSLSAHMKDTKTVHAYFDYVYTEIVTEEKQKQFKSIFNRDALLRHFADGKTTLSLEFRRQIEGRIYWVVATVHMMKKETGDIVAFLYSVDVTNERTMQNIMDAIAKTDYDFLLVADIARNTAIRYTQKTIGDTYVHETTNFIEESRDRVRRFVCPGDVDRLLDEILLDTVLQQLEVMPSYSVFYRMPNPNGGVFKKQLRFSYIDRDRQSLLLTRVDITAAVEEQEKRNRELVSAVAMAERANAAKSEFLSRISHELRTPMNAIMGMDQLAAQRLNDPIFIRECIEKSQYASRYLLQLLNDILDMSKIETGKVTLKMETIACQPFLDAICTIVGTQAEKKGVHYTVTKFEGCKYSYLGDSVRLQQILINILTNAVKFTGAGGTVHLDIAQLYADEKTARICFTISDTGIGIGRAFLSDIFKPFSQEHSGTRSGYGGSGLGLAISKHLAELMGGDIFVESVQGKGTTFRVEIPFGIPEYDGIEGAPVVLKSQDTYDFSGRRILLIEDHPLNIMVAKKLLEFRNATVEVAENGKIGLDKFAAAPQCYDAVLMDIRMPVMDGLEAATAIRGLDSPWAKTVPILAMSANAFDEDVVKSKDAGMDAHLAKPIEAELLYQTLYEQMEKSNGKAGNSYG